MFFKKQYQEPNAIKDQILNETKQHHSQETLNCHHQGGTNQTPAPVRGGTGIKNARESPGQSTRYKSKR